MNDEAVLERFLEEAYDLLSEGGRALLELERSPTDVAHLDTVFRAFHTLKGSSALFDLKPITRVVHAGEDLLHLVREGQAQLSGNEVDLLLSVLDQVKSWLGLLEHHGSIPPAANETAAELIERARSLGGDAIAAEAVPGVVALRPTANETPDWLKFTSHIPEFVGHALIGIEYTPDPGCFFAGDDPLRLMSLVPSLLYLRVVEDAGAADEHPDPFQCRLRFRAVTAAPLAEVRQLLAYASEQVKLYEFSVGLGAEADLAIRVLQEISASLGEPAEESVQGARLAANVALADNVLRASGFPLQWLQEFRRIADLALLQQDEVSVQRAALRIVDHIAEASRCGMRMSMLPQAIGRLSRAPVGRPTLQPPALARSGAPPRPADLQLPPSDALKEAAPPQHAAAALPKIGVEKPAPADDSRSRAYKVDESRIDALLSLAGELLVVRNAFPYLSRRADGVFKVPQLAREIKDQASNLSRIAENFHHAVMQLRIIPLSHVFDRFPRLVRDISRQLGKQVALEIEGGDTEADKSTVEKLAEPLIHIVRNSLDHGLEAPDERVNAGKPAQGRIRIRAQQERGTLIVSIEDDGRGIDPVKMRATAVKRGLMSHDAANQLSDQEARALIFRAGFSTRDAITDLSGRGVGMDVVRTVVEACHGSIQLESNLGAGTRIALCMPLSMAVTRVLLVEAEAAIFGVPFDLVRETVHIERSALACVRGAQVVMIRDRVVPLVWLRDALDLPHVARKNADGSERLKVLLARVGSGEVGVVVDSFHEAVEVMLRPLEGPLAALRGYLGSSLLGDGRALLVLNLSELIDQAHIGPASNQNHKEERFDAHSV